MNDSDSSKEVRKTGEVLEALPSLQFRVKLEDSDQEIMAYVSGKLRMHRIRILPGDTVQIVMSPYDEKRGRIVYRGIKQ
jgi:translation initiation factor IF-1